MVVFLNVYELCHELLPVVKRKPRLVRFLAELSSLA